MKSRVCLKSRVKFDVVNSLLRRGTSRKFFNWTSAEMFQIFLLLFDTFSIECRKWSGMLSFLLTSLRDWLGKTRPISWKTKTNFDWSLAFSRLQAVCVFLLWVLIGYSRYLPIFWLAILTALFFCLSLIYIINSVDKTSYLATPYLKLQI